MTFQWRGQDYWSVRSETGFAAILIDGANPVIIKIKHSDQIDVLRESLEAFIKKHGKKSHCWRAVDAAKDLIAQLEQKAQPA